LKRGDILGTSSVVGKIRIMEDFQGKAIKKAFPSMPVVVLGLENVPGVGEKLKVFANIETAKEQVIKKELGSLKLKGTGFLKEDKKVLNIILKIDVLGSLEAIEQVLKELPQEKVVLKILKAEVGEINESDLKLAMGSKAKVIGFRVKADPIAQRLAEREKIKIISFDVIYELAQAVRELLGKRISSGIVRNDLGKVKVLEIFLTEKNRQIIGGKVTDGEVKRGASLDIYRNEEKIGQGKITKLQKEKKEIVEVGKGAECGMLYQGDVKVEQGDILHAYIKETRKGEL